MDETIMRKEREKFGKKDSRGSKGWDRNLSNRYLMAKSWFFCWVFLSCQVVL